MSIADTANTAELVWVAIGLVTGAVNTVLWVIAIRDLKAVYASRQNGAKRIEAWTWFWAHAILVFIQCIAVSIGVYAAIVPPANPARPLTTLGAVIAAGLVTKQLLNCVMGIFLILRRGKLDAYLDGRMHAGLVIPVERITVQQAVDESYQRQEDAARGGIPDDM